jgi:hypothetical protein
MVNWGMIGAMVLPNVGGWAGSLITVPNIPTWYEVSECNVMRWNDNYCIGKTR